MQYFFYTVGYITLMLTIASVLLGDNVTAAIGCIATALTFLGGIFYDSTEN